MTAVEESTKHSPFDYRFIQMIGLVVLVALPLVFRALTECRKYMNAAHEAQSAHKISEVIDNYRLALSWRMPWEQAAQEASFKLLEIAQDETLADSYRIEALDQLERGLASSRSWVWNIPGTWNGVTEGAVAKYREQLILAASPIVRETYTPEISYSWQLAAQLFFWGWIFTTARIIWTGFTPAGAAKQNFWLLLPMPAILFVAWLIALEQA